MFKTFCSIIYSILSDILQCLTATISFTKTDKLHNHLPAITIRLTKLHVWRKPLEDDIF